MDRVSGVKALQVTSGAERRVCSLLFVDLVGFTPLAEARDAEEVREILSRYFDVARRVIRRYGGVVEKFIGDAVMAVWGAPVAEEGDTERAVRAALDVVEAVAVLGEEVGAAELTARAGVVTAEVAVTVGAEGEGMVAGDAVNTAARVQSVAEAGSVLVDASTKRLSEPAVVFVDAGDFELKGKSEPERLFTAVRVVAGVGGVQWGPGLESPLVGRDAELRAVKELLHACIDRRTPRLVVMNGPAGVGKSRLGWELERYMDGLADTVLWHRGRCLSYGEGIAFWALAEIVRQRLGIAEEDSTSVAAEKLRDGLARLVDEEAERDYLGIRLERLLGVPYQGPTPAVLSPEDLYAGWRLFFEHLARIAPVVLVVEDAQHADVGLLGFLEHLVDWTRSLPVFILLLARPGHAVIDGGWGIGRNRSTLSLDPLDSSSMDRLVDSLVPGMPATARGVIVGRAEGIPLFAVETVRSLLDQGIVADDASGSYQLVGDLGQLRVPDSLHALLAARLDALPADARALAAAASVIGTSFSRDALVAVSGRNEQTVSAGLAELVHRDVLEVIADPLSPEQGAYRFSQELLRQVAYGTLSRRNRRSLHLAVASHLRSTFARDGEEIADAIARHYLDALDAAPADPDSPALRTEALGFLVRAAERTARSGAPARAAQLYVRASEIAQPEDAASLLERAAGSWGAAGQFETAVELAQAAAEAQIDLGHRRAAARAQSIEGDALRSLGRHESARAALRGALDALREPADADTVTVLNRLGTLETFSGNTGFGRQLITEALELAQALGLPAGELAGLFIAYGVNAGFTGRLAEAAASFREATRLAEQAGDDVLLGHAQLDLADTLSRSDPRSAADSARSAVTRLRRTGQPSFLAVAVNNLAVALTDLGEWDEAGAVLDDAVTTDNLDQPHLSAWAGFLAGLRGQIPREAAVEDATSALLHSEDAQDQAVLALLRTAAALAGDDAAAALTYSMAVLDHTEALGIGAETTRWAWPIAVRAARRIGDQPAVLRLLALLDSHPAGHQPSILRGERQLVAALATADATAVPSSEELTAVEAGVEAVRQAANPYHLAHALIDHAELLVLTQQPGYDEALEEAAAIAEKLGCPPILERVARTRAHTDSIVSPPGSAADDRVHVEDGPSLSRSS